MVSGLTIVIRIHQRGNQLGALAEEETGFCSKCITLTPKGNLHILYMGGVYFVIRFGTNLITEVWVRRRLGEFIVSNEIMRGGEWRNFTGGFFFVVVPVKLVICSLTFGVIGGWSIHQPIRYCGIESRKGIYYRHCSLFGIDLFQLQVWDLRRSVVRMEGEKGSQEKLLEVALLKWSLISLIITSSICFRG